MKKYSRLYWAALLLICTVIPFLFFGKLQKSEALRFFESFIEPSDLSVDENGVVYWHYSPADSCKKITLKYADELKFDTGKKISIDKVNAYDGGRSFWFEATGSTDSEPFYPESGCILLKHMDGIWYRISSCNYGLDPPWFAPDIPLPAIYEPIVFPSDDWVPTGPFYTLPSGRYYLYISATKSTDSDKKTTELGAAMVEIELAILSGESKYFNADTRTYFTYIPESYTKDFPKYSVKIIGETLYHDPYA